MQSEITASPLVDILSKQLGKPVVMSGENYVYLDTKDIVIQSEVDIALEAQQDELLTGAKANKLIQIEEDFQTAEGAVVKLTHATHGDITYAGGAESADKIDKYIRLRNMAGLIDGHMIWNESGVETAHTDAEAKAVIIAIGNASSANDFTKKDRKLAVALIDLTALEDDGETLTYPKITDATTAVELI